jgi:hypothetical protein
MSSSYKAYNRDEQESAFMENKDRIVEAAKDVTVGFAREGYFDKYMDYKLYWNIDTDEIATVTFMSGLTQEFFDDIEEGREVLVYEDTSGYLGDAADESWEVYGESDAVSDKKLTEEEIELAEDCESSGLAGSKEERLAWEKYLEIKDTYIDEYIDNYVDELVEENVYIRFKE